jgi:predicted membrane chloride channel (bestrophin family)
LNGTYTFLVSLQPVPFPLIQMARTFLFSYIFTIPLVFLQDKASVVYHCIAVFVITYGFVGLEMVAIAIDDPFGTDDVDFDNVGMAETAYEDVYLNILHIDGPEWTEKLRLRMHTAFDDSKPITEQTYLLDNVI